MSSVRVLAVIASYGRGSDKYLHRLIDEYRSMPFTVDVVVCSNLEKPLPDGVELVVGMPTSDPWSLPFAHKAILAARANEYDLFIYSEDDTLATVQNIQAFLRVSAVLPAEEVPGFLRYERQPDGTISYCDVNGHYHWDPASVVQRGEYTFAFFTNEHAAFYLLTRKQLAHAIQSGGFLVPPHRGKYDLACTAATDPYTQCGFRKLVCISHLHEFLLHHLPNKYVGTRFGTHESLFDKQVRALLKLNRENVATQSLVPVETKLRDAWYSKDYYEPVRPEVVKEVSQRPQRVLSVGCGSGEMERYLASRGARVTALCLDPVIAACVQDAAIETICVSPELIQQALTDRSYDCLLISNILHLAPSPSVLLSDCGRFVAPGGHCVILTPNLRTVKNLFGALRRDHVFRPIGRYEDSGTHVIQFSDLRKWLKAAQFRVTKATRIVSSSKQRMSRWTLGALDSLLANEMLVVGRRGQARTDCDGKTGSRNCPDSQVLGVVTDTRGGRAC